MVVVKAKMGGVQMGESRDGDKEGTDSYRFEAEGR